MNHKNYETKDHQSRKISKAWHRFVLNVRLANIRKHLNIILFRVFGDVFVVRCSANESSLDRPWSVKGIFSKVFWTPRGWQTSHCLNYLSISCLYIKKCLLVFVTKCPFLIKCPCSGLHTIRHWKQKLYWLSHVKHRAWLGQKWIYVCFR